ncbi:hypothetical protein BH160DRAFT_6898 [Burkholderia sp. H160]|nr:hypothetical protein BH160DRAFT_6898 [Burkholderia sp. H160]
MNSKLRPDLGRRGGPRFGRAGNVIVHALRCPCEQTLVVLEPRKLRSATLGEHSDVDRGMKPRRRCDGSLPNCVHQPQRAKILEDARPSGPGNLTILRSPQRFKYGFVGIRGHLTSFLKCTYDTFMPTRHCATGDARSTRPWSEARRLSGSGFPPGAAWSHFRNPRQNGMLALSPRTGDATAAARWQARGFVPKDIRYPI